LLSSPSSRYELAFGAFSEPLVPAVPSGAGALGTMFFNMKAVRSAVAALCPARSRQPVIVVFL
jgi:hypothetical protein